MEKKLRFRRRFFGIPVVRLSLMVWLMLFSFNAQGLFSMCLAVPQLVVTKVDELCDGGGIITCTITNPTPGGSIQFKVFQLPDLVSPIAVLNSNGAQVTGLDAATYQVVATETVNGVPNTLPSQNVTIEDHIQPLDFVMTKTDEHCNDGTITVNITSGYAVSYAIFAGPVTVAPQPSPFFSNLPAGLYTVHAIDACGTIKAHSFTVPHDDIPLQIGPTGYAPQLPDCNHITILHSTVPVDPVEDDIFYPLMYTYTVYPPGNGTPIVVTYTETAGGEDIINSGHVLPFYYDQLYYYDLTITDSCNNSFSLNHNPVNQKLFAGISVELGDCGQYYFSVSPTIYVPPYQINFTSFPAGFDPTVFNPSHPGPFTSAQTFYGGPHQTVPFGTYTGTLTDSCGHTAVFEQEIQDVPLMTEVIPHPLPGCQSDFSDIELQAIGYNIDHIVVISAPPTFPFPLPYDVPASAITEPTVAWLYNYPAGDYSIILYDDCGIAHPKDFTVFPSSVNNAVSHSTRADCEPGRGGLRLRGGNFTTLTSAIITAAPAGFPFPLPFDATSYINATTGILTMANLLPGDYTVTLTDNCAPHGPETFAVMAYAVSGNTVTVAKHCSAFDVYLSHTSNATLETFWLQQLNEVTGIWMHPSSGIAYVPGTPLTNTNAIPLTNHFNNINQLFLGTFRVIKMFQAYEDGFVGSTKNCFETLLEFENTGEVKITDVVKLTCDGALISVKVIADGVPPFHYKIIAKNGGPFLIDNGGNDTFADLEPAVYTFSVEHFCGQAVTKIVDIASLPSLVTAIQPNYALVECDGDDQDGKADFDLSQFDPTIIGTQNPADFSVTYHDNAADAADGLNPLPVPYYTGSALLYARLKYLPGDSCYDLVEVEVVVHPYPAPDMPVRYPLCAGGTVTLEAEAGYDSYLWSTGETTMSISVATGGNYSVTVTENHQGITCTGTVQVEVFPIVSPSISNIEVNDWTDHENSVVVHTNEPDTGDFLYSIDGTHFQSSNVFEGLLPGEYHIIVKDLGDCSFSEATVFLLMYPRFFTPNADGYNDYWKVKFDYNEPDLYTYIFDRYGKLITGFPVGGPGWDGTYNGRTLPSTDYWFVVRRQNGAEMRGHFAMKR